MVGKYEEAIANYTEMETLAHRRGDRAVELAALIALASVYALGETLASGEFAQSLCDQALALARELDDHAAEAKVLWTLMLLNTYLSNHPRKAVEYGERSLAIARELDLRQQMAYTLHNLGYALMQGGANKRALDAFEQARTLWRELDNQPLLADNLAISALTLLLSGQAQRSTALVDEAHSINQRIGNPWGLTMTYVAQGMLYAEALQPDRAIPALEESIRVGESIGTAGMTASARCVRAWLIGSLGKFERGIELAFDAIEFIDQRYPIWSAWPRAVLTRLYLLKGNLAEAERSSDGSWHASVEEYFSRFIPPGGMATCMTRAELLLARKDFDRALEFADTLYVFLQTGGFDLYVPDTLFFKGCIWLAQARSDQADALFAQARRTAEDANARGVLWHILLALSRIEDERGNTTESRTLRAQARQIVESVAAHTPVELKNAFRNLSEVQEILN